MSTFEYYAPDVIGKEKYYYKETKKKKTSGKERWWSASPLHLVIEETESFLGNSRSIFSSPVRFIY